MPSPARFNIPVGSFRHLETPFEKEGYRDYFAVADIKHLPDFTGWRKINVRDPKMTGAVPRKIREGVHDPEMFLFMNRGLVLSVDSVSFDNKTSLLTVVMKDPKLHGLLDGGHTYNILLEERDSLEESQYVKIEILQGFDPEGIERLVDARNTSNQVRDESLMNLAGEFDKLKKALAGQRYANLIAYKEYELIPGSDEPKPIDVREVIAILTAFEKEHFTANVHPINAYRSKAACLQHFKDHSKAYEKIYPLAPDILELHDRIHLELPELYNKAGGKFGNLTGVTRYKGKRKAPLLFIGEEAEYGVPAGFVYPVLAAFRALLKEKNGRYVWGKGLTPTMLLKGDLGQVLADTIGNFARDARNPSKTGKQPLVWQACYQAAQVAFLTAA